LDRARQAGGDEQRPPLPPPSTRCTPDRPVAWWGARWLPRLCDR